MTNANDDSRIAASLEEQLDHAAEELIAGDSDDPPLSEETVVEMIRTTHTGQTLGSLSDDSERRFSRPISKEVKPHASRRCSWLCISRL